MAKKKTANTFSEFISDPPIAIALIVFALIALVLTLMEFSQAIAFWHMYSIKNSTGSIYTPILQFSIIIFSVSLVWFAFVYYPKITNQFSNVGLPKQKFVPQAVATSSTFPIQTLEFRIIYEKGSGAYYAFIEGDNLASFADNKNRATLAIKSTLSIDSICRLNVIYVSTKELDIPQEYKSPASCR